MAQAAPGFYTIGNEKIPKTIANAGASTFQIVIIDNPPRHQVRREDYAKFDEAYAKQNIGYNLVAEKIRECERADLEACPIPYSGMATAFLAGSSDTLWTVRHVFGDNPINLIKADPHFMLFDSKGEQIFDTENGTDAAKFEVIGDPAPLAKSTVMRNSTDFAKIKLSRVLKAPALSVAQGAPEYGDDVFLAGYPVTNPGLRVSVGVRIRPSDAGIHPTTQVPRTSADMKISQFLFVHDADMIYGQSGAPLLDKDGNVIAIGVAHSAKSIPSFAEGTPFSAIEGYLKSMTFSARHE